MNEVDFNAAIEVLHQHQLTHIIEDWFIEYVQSEMRDVIAPKFWSYFAEEKDSLSVQLNNFVLAVDYLYSALDKHNDSIEKIESITNRYPPSNYRTGTLFKKSLKETATTLCKALLFSSKDRKIFKVTESFYLKAFKVYQHTSSDEQSKLALI